MNQNWKPMTLRMVKTNHPKIFDEFESLAKPYCTRLFDLGEEHNGIPDFIASGTFVRINGRPGILTNHHVAMIFDLKKRSWVYVSEYKSEKIQGLKMNLIISLPHYPQDEEMIGVDISFIELASETAILDLGYKIWDLDESAKKYFQNEKSLNMKDNMNNYLWGCEATPSEKVSKQGNVLYFEKSGFHFLAPDIPDFPIAMVRSSNGDLFKKIDEMYCEIDRNGIDGAFLPKSYGGTSGSAAWRGIGELPAETITDFDLSGILVEEVKIFEGQPAMALKCRGCNSLYDTFYKFCTHYLVQENEIAALEYAGFR